MAELTKTLVHLQSLGVFTAMVYLQEAHADDLWPLGYGIHRHTCLWDRLGACQAFLRKHLDLVASLDAIVVDNMDDGFLHTYGAWPERYFLADLSGKVLWASTVSNDETMRDSTVRALDSIRALVSSL